MYHAKTASRLLPRPSRARRSSSRSPSSDTRSCIGTADAEEEAEQVLHERDPFRHPHDRRVRFAKCGAASGRQHDVFLGAASAHGFGFARERADQALAFQAPQCAVDRAKRGLALRALDERRANRHAIGVVTEPRQRQEDRAVRIHRGSRPSGPIIYCTLCTIYGIIRRDASEPIAEGGSCESTSWLLRFSWAVGIDASAQEFTGSIYGRIVDPSNAVMPGVSITVEGAAIQGQRTAESEANGSYRFLYLPPGEYRVTYQKARFKKIVYEGAKVEVGKTLTMNVTMQIADIEETCGRHRRFSDRRCAERDRRHELRRDDVARHPQPARPLCPACPDTRYHAAARGRRRQYRGNAVAISGVRFVGPVDHDRGRRQHHRRFRRRRRLHRLRRAG